MNVYRCAKEIWKTRNTKRKWKEKVDFFLYKFVLMILLEREKGIFIFIKSKNIAQ